MLFFRLDLNALDSAENVFSKKLFYNVTHAGLNIPVQVIYDLPPQPHLRSGDKIARRNSKQRNFSTDIESIKDNLKKYYLKEHVIDALNSPKSSVANTKGAISLTLNAPPQWEESHSTDRKALPVVLTFKPPPSNDDSVFTIIKAIVSDKNDVDINNQRRTVGVVDRKYIAPILEKLEEFNKNRNEGSGGVEENAGATMNSVGQAHLVAPGPSDILPLAYDNYAMAPAYFWTSPPYYWPLEMQRQTQWPSPFAQYFPIIIRDPFQSVLNYFSDLVEYGPSADVCQRDLSPHHYQSANLRQHDTSASFPLGRIKRAAMYEMNADGNAYNDNDSNNEEEEKEDDDDNGDDVNNSNNDGVLFPVAHGRRRYDEDIANEYGAQKRRRLGREKRNMRKKESRGKYTYADNNAKRENAAEEQKKKGSPVEGKQAAPEIGAQPVRATDVGPQISKLIVRRGGVAIAGAGGIATAGSGGTAIVGPGGTAFTTPASSGGVAMVGPGGKVVKVPDLTSVLYGRTNGVANIAATGAGHATFTNKDGEVFTTSDNTGGVALVNPGGSVLGLSDDRDNFEQTSKVQETAKEVHLPAGARLLTTGPIIYYNPIYPISQQLRR